MRNCLCFTGILTLFIGWHLFIPKLVHPQGEIGTANNIPLSHSVISNNDNGSLKLNPSIQENSGFEPPNNAGPDNTRGSGTR